MKDTCFLMTTSLGAHVKTGEKFQFIIIIIIIIILLLLLLLLLVLVLVLLSLKKRSRNKAKIFAKLVMEGQIKAALRYLRANVSKGRESSDRTKKTNSILFNRKIRLGG